MGLVQVTPEDLFDLDQDHYGGLEAVEALARQAGVHRGSRVLDLCSGLGGPARFLASRMGCRVTGVELTHSRCASAMRLTRLVGMSGMVVFVGGDAVRLPFRPGSFTVCLSQEAFLHVPDKVAVLAECARVLIPGGRLAFTDWVAGARLSPGEPRRSCRPASSAAAASPPPAPPLRGATASRGPRGTSEGARGPPGGRCGESSPVAPGWTASR